ncbi:uncharacterized protein EURHEDRAFT_405637 [Aspergillus ruber CBS 135680]|uniref:Uncharacterized protein n=1 Tax=Aspergillus ruber (strain CBS 135680) TaxID=1388766 RepID=A0A017S557_ASPRC|nr:uncharacterized protein EURHEDRAFT_405637 [Aspergillus ruber CBS 135680]EYE91976.1 hypothetical protein EURHEDRAFT_405637 [Aspergillus ruber CBS 135680]
MTNLVCTALTDKYDLDLGAKTQPSVNIDDLLFTTYHLMALSDMHFPTSQAIDSVPPYTLKRALKPSQCSDVPSGTLRVIGLLMQRKPFDMNERKYTKLPLASQPDLRIPVLCTNIEKEQQQT